MSYLSINSDICTCKKSLHIITPFFFHYPLIILLFVIVCVLQPCMRCTLCYSIAFVRLLTLSIYTCMFVKPMKPIKSKQKSLFDKQSGIVVKYYWVKYIQRLFIGFCIPCCYKVHVDEWFSTCWRRDVFKNRINWWKKLKALVLN